MTQGSISENDSKYEKNINLLCSNRATDLHQRYETSYTTLCNGIVSYGAQFGGLWVFVHHTCKNKCKKMHSRSSHAMQRFCTCVPSRSDHCTCRKHTHLMSHDYFDYGETQRPPNSAQCLDQDGATLTF